MEVFAQVAIPMANSLPEDASVNTWTFTTSLSAGAAESAVGTGLLAFYDEIGQYLSPYAVPADTIVKQYDLADPEPRAPFAQGTLPITSAPTVDAYPNEVAVCLSFRGTLVSGSNPARRRGRIYLGPLSVGVGGGSGSSGGPTVASSFLDALEDATAALQTGLGAQTNHVVWSRTDSAFIPVSTYWCDDAFDTQRSRGIQSTSRRTWAQGT